MLSGSRNQLTLMKVVSSRLQWLVSTVVSCVLIPIVSVVKDQSLLFLELNEQVKM